MYRIHKLTLSCKGMAILAFTVAAGSNSFAAQITITGHADYRAGSGGEFNVRAADAGGNALLAPSLALGYTIVNGTDFGGPTGGDGTQLRSDGEGGQNGFETFCIEFNEHINLPGTYSASISGGSIYGGVAGGIDHDSNPLTPNTDLISIGTAYLYEQFAKGTLAGYTYANGAGRAASAVQLQNAFWFLEDEISLDAAAQAANPFLFSVFTQFADPKSNNNIYDVAVLNLGGESPTQKQDQLILREMVFSVPDGGMTVALMGVSLGCLFLLGRKLA